MLARAPIGRAATGFSTRTLVSLLAALLVVAAAATIWWRHTQTLTPPTTYQTAKATVGTVATTVSATGPVSSAQSIPLSFKSSGTIKKFDVQIGDTVRA